MHRTPSSHPGVASTLPIVVDCHGVIGRVEGYERLRSGSPGLRVRLPDGQSLAVARHVLEPCTEGGYYLPISWKAIAEPDDCGTGRVNVSSRVHVVALFPELRQAHVCARALTNRGFDRECIQIVVEEHGDDPPRTRDPRDSLAVAAPLMQSLMVAGVPEEYAAYYAEGVRRGGALVRMLIADGIVETAVEILEQHDPIDIEAAVGRWHNEGWTRGRRSA